MNALLRITGMGILVAGLLAGCVRGRTVAETRPVNPNFQQDRFCIGLWVDPPIDARAEARYAELADANFSMIIGGSGASDPKGWEHQLDLCQQFGLKALLQCPGTEASKLPDGPACWGYAVRDEPAAKDFPQLRAQVDAIRKARPGKLAYINLFPNYASAAQLGTSTYEEHVTRFLDEVGVDVLSMDHYPIFRPEKDGRDGYCENLAVMRTESQRKQIPFWNFFNTMPYGGHTDPTEDQLRWQIYASLAYGAKGVLYFCYYTPAGDEFPKGGAIIGRDDRPTRHYEQARHLNGELKNLGATLMQLTSTGVLRVAQDTDPAAVLKDSPLKNITGAPYDPKPDYLVGLFKHADGRRAVLLQNYRFAYTAWPTVEFDVPANQVTEVCKVTGKEVPVHDASPALDGLQVSLDAGEGRLFLLPPK